MALAAIRLPGDPKAEAELHPGEDSLAGHVVPGDWIPLPCPILILSSQLSERANDLPTAELAPAWILCPACNGPQPCGHLPPFPS